MNRDALRATAHNGCIQPVRGSYGAIHIAAHRRPRATIRPRTMALVLLLVGLGVAVYFFLAGALSPRPSARILSPLTNSTVPAEKATVTLDVQVPKAPSTSAPSSASTKTSPAKADGGC